MSQGSLDQRIPGEARHQPELDGIRGLAILMVLGSHATGLLGVLPHERPHWIGVSAATFFLTPGWSGVDLFFVLSGFLITGILLRTRTEPAYFRSFYARRALRIFPIYYLALIASLVAAHFLPSFAATLPPPGWPRGAYFLYLQNMPAFWPSSLGMFTAWGVYWSLAAEEQFYLIWPMLVRFFSSRAMLGICIVAMLLELPLRLLLQHVYFGLHVGLIQFTPDRADGLFAGAAVALYTHIYKRPVPKPWIKLAAGFGVLIVLVVVAVTPLALVGDGYFYTVGITAFALLSASLVAWSQYHPPRLQAWLTWRPLRIAGKYSYGMYVYHLFIYRAIHVVCQRFSPAYNGQLSALPAFCVIALAILLVTLIAKLSFELLERPLLGLKRFFPAAG